MVNQISALQKYVSSGRFGSKCSGGVTLAEVREFYLIQIAAWPDTVASVGNFAANMVGCQSAPELGRAVLGEVATLLRVEPLKWWILAGSDARADFGECEAVVLDLTHSRTRLRISGPCAAQLLNHHLPLDLRYNRFPVGAVGLSAIHHVGVTLWRDAQGFELLVPRSFAASIWHLLFNSARQYGVEITSEH